MIVANLAPMLTPIGGFGFEPRLRHQAAYAGHQRDRRLRDHGHRNGPHLGLRYKGVKGWLKGLVSPTPVMLPFNLMEYAIKPLSLCLRLFGNILGAYIIMLLIEAVAPVIFPPIAGLYFDLFDGLIQAVVFAFLSTIYIAEAIE